MDFGCHTASYRADGSTEGDLFAATIDRARWLEDEGFDLFTGMGHVWQIPGVGKLDEPFFDCYTALPAIAQVTDRMELSALVTCPHWRNPAPRDEYRGVVGTPSGVCEPLPEFEDVGLDTFVAMVPGSDRRTRERLADDRDVQHRMAFDFHPTGDRTQLPPSFADRLLRYWPRASSRGR